MPSQSDDKPNIESTSTTSTRKKIGNHPLVHKADIGGTEDSRDWRMRFSFPAIATSERGHLHTIKLKLRDMGQLFNSMDPSPFIEKELDADAEEFIVSWAHECPPGAPIKLRIYLDEWPVEDPKEPDGRSQPLLPPCSNCWFGVQAPPVR
jgi:hypothetical protein